MAPEESTDDTANEPRDGPGSFVSRPGVVLALIVVVIVALNANILDNQFLSWDDSLYVTENARVQISDLSDLARVMSPADALAGRFVEYFPLRDAIYALLFYFFGLEPLAYHVAQIALHVATSLLLFVCARSWLGTSAALTATALFAVHPVHVESIAWISALKDPLFSLLVLGSIHFYGRYARGAERPWRPYAASLVCLALALLCKSIAVVTPVLLLLVDWLVSRDLKSKRAWLDKAPHVVACLLALGLFVVVGRANSVIVDPPGGTAATGFMTMTMVFGRYLLTLVYPFALSARYVIRPVVEVSDLRFIAAGAVILVAWVSAVRMRHLSRVPLFGLAWLTTCLLPVMNIVPIPIEMADRYLYLPSMGFCVALAWTAESAYGRTKLRSGIAIFLTAGFLLFALASHRRNEVWQNDITLWEDVIAQAPSFYIGRNNLARAYIASGRLGDARGQLEAALALKPGHVPTLMNLGGLYERQRRYAEADATYRRALEIDPSYEKALNNIGVLLIQQRRFLEARAPLERATESNPDYAHAQRNLAYVCTALGDFPCAVEHIERAATLRPADPTTFSDLLRILDETGSLDRLPRWQAHFERRFSDDPNIVAEWRRLSSAR